MDQKKVGVLLSYAQTVLSTVISLIYTPIMLRLLGTSEYGLYTLVNGFISNLNLLGFGLSNAYFRFYARAQEKKGEDGVAHVNGMFMAIYLFIGLLSLIVGGILVANVHVIFAAKLTPQEIERARLLMAMLVISIAISFPLSVYSSYVLVKERFLFQNLCGLIRTILNPIIMLPMLLLGWGSVSLVAVALILRLFTDVCNYVCCKKKLGMRMTFGRFDFGMVREMFAFSFFIFLNMMINQINWTVDTTILGIISGTVATAIYGVGSQIHNYYMALSTAISNVFIPQINRIVARGGEDCDRELTGLFTRVGRVQFMLLMLVLTGFAFVGLPFVLAWGGADYADAYPIALLLMGPVTIPLIQNLGIEIQRAKNMHQFRSIVYFFMALGNVAISVPLGMKFGGIGCALGTAISMIVGNTLVMNWYYHKHIGLDILYFWKSIASILPSMIVPVLLGAAAVSLWDFGGYSGVLCFAVPYALVFCAFVYAFGMDADERNMVRGMARKLLRR